SIGPLTYGLPAIALVMAQLYFVYGALDHLALATQYGQARVIDRQFAQDSTTYNRTVIGDGTWSIESKNGEVYLVGLDLDGELTGAAVTSDQFESFWPGDKIRVEFQRTLSLNGF